MRDLEEVVEGMRVVEYRVGCRLQVCVVDWDWLEREFG